MGPDRRGLVPLPEQPIERRRCVRGWNAECQPAARRRESIFHAVHQKFLERVHIGHAPALFQPNEPGIDRTLDARVCLGGGHAELARELAVRPGCTVQNDDFEQDAEILGLEAQVERMAGYGGADWVGILFANCE